MLDSISNDFLQTPTEDNALSILKYTRYNNLFNIGIILGKFFSSLFPKSVHILEEFAINAYYAKKYPTSYDIFNQALELRGLDENTSSKLLFNQHFSINPVCDRYTTYEIKKVREIMERPKSKLPMVTLSITTCKRFDLFHITMNTILNCIDINMIDKWLCVDDNSTEEDRIKMKNLYPFFTFIFKDPFNKGHPRSMNIIKETVNTPYLLHLEDDWKFFSKRSFIQDALEVLQSNPRIGQCLFNKNYSETGKDIDVKGGIFKTTHSGLRYYEHEYVSSEIEKQNWFRKYGNCLSSNYWPHYSLRPSVIRTSVFRDIGDFTEDASHFEMEYAYRYAAKGYISVFFEGLYCIHIGRLTSEKHDENKINAYKLNNEAQFIKKPLTPVQECSEIDMDELDFKLKTHVINLDRRRDRWENFEKRAKQASIQFLNYERFSAIDGNMLRNTTQLQRIFDGNDYNMMVGAVGCAMSHFKIYTDLINSPEYEAVLILEDDITFCKNFDVKFFHICKQIKNLDWDLVFIGHHPRNLHDSKYKNDNIPFLEKWDVYSSFQNSLGGTVGYIINKKGAIRVLDFINKNKMINCIDTMLQKSCNELDIYYSVPNLVFSDCFRHFENKENLDSDIQSNFKSLSVSLETKIQMEIDYFTEKGIPVQEETDCNSVLGKDAVVYFKGDNLSLVKNMCKDVSYYCIDDKVIFILNRTLKDLRYTHIFKVGDVYSIEDCLN